MRQAWRWFGPRDPVPLDYIRQAGVTDIVSALHDVPIGTAWEEEEVREHQAIVAKDNSEKSKLKWTVVESIPVHDSIKRGDKNAQMYIDAYIESLRAISAAGIKIVCYNYMPLLDWTRTDLRWKLPSGGKALRFDATAFAAFDLFILKRPKAEGEYDKQRIKKAEKMFNEWKNDDIDTVTKNVLAGLPGGTTEAHTINGFQKELDRYNGISSDDLRNNLVTFLNKITPAAEEFNIRLAIHPDDPPRPLLGLPRVVSTHDDLKTLFSAVPSPSNGLTFCTGSLGVRPDNDLVKMAVEFAENIHFAHLRGTRREIDEQSFYEAEHLDSDVDMIGVITKLIIEERRRNANGIHDQQIPFRPDHGHQILDDQLKDSNNPGYTAIGRLKGLAELRGAITAIEQMEHIK